MVLMAVVFMLYLELITCQMSNFFFTLNGCFEDELDSLCRLVGTCEDAFVPQSLLLLNVKNNIYIAGLVKT